MPTGQYEHKSGIGSSAGSIRTINGKHAKLWITLPNGKHVKIGPNKSTNVVLGKGGITDYNFPYTHKKEITSDGLTYKSGETEMINLYEYLNSAKMIKEKELEKLNYAKMIKEKELEKQRRNTTTDNFDLLKRQTTYSCPACGNAIKKTDTRCSKCKVLMDWT